MNFSRNQIIIIGILGLVILFFILVFVGVIPGLKNSGPGVQEVSLVFWGIDNPNSIQPLIEEYQKVNSNVRITYRRIESDSYEKSLIDALATGQGPDILMFNNNWLSKHYNKVVSAPATQLSTDVVGQIFPTIVSQNFISGGQVYALPLYIDTLALLYNKNVLDAAAVAVLPRTWDEFQIILPGLKKINQFNQIIKPAAAIGGSEKSIDKASDLLNELMAQFAGGPQNIIGQDGSVRFGNEELSALNFYVGFANPANLYNTWNDSLPYSLDSFADGSTAMIFNYASILSKIKSKNPYFDFGVSQMPRLTPDSQPVNYADYWGLAVSKQSKNSAWAWHFIVSITTNSEIAELYIQNASLPPALLTLIERYKNDAKLGVFARQALTARSWPQPDNTEVKRIFSNMIESILNGKASAKNALDEAQNAINNL